MCWVQSVRVNCRRSSMAAKRRGSQRAALREGLDRRTTVELIRVKENVPILTRRLPRKAFSPMTVRGSSEPHIRNALALSCPVGRLFGQNRFLGVTSGWAVRTKPQALRSLRLWLSSSFVGGIVCESQEVYHCDSSSQNDARRARAS